MCKLILSLLEFLTVCTGRHFTIKPRLDTYRMLYLPPLLRYKLLAQQSRRYLHFLAWKVICTVNRRILFQILAECGFTGKTGNSRFHGMATHKPNIHNTMHLIKALSTHINPMTSQGQFFVFICNKISCAFQ